MLSFFKKKDINIKTEKNCVYAPIDGKLIKLASVEDKLFADEILGKGAAIEPCSNIVYAPVSGTVTVAPNTCHAIAILSDDDVEVLVHIGINTVELKGKYFKKFVEKGDSVKAGQKIIEFDREKVHKAGYKTTTPVIITNSEDYENVSFIGEQVVEKMQKIIEVK